MVTYCGFTTTKKIGKWKKKSGADENGFRIADKDVLDKERDWTGSAILYHDNRIIWKSYSQN